MNDETRISKIALNRKAPVDQRILALRAEIKAATDPQVYCKAVCALAYRVIEERAHVPALVQEADTLLVDAYKAADRVRNPTQRARWRSSSCAAMVYLFALGRRDLPETTAHAIAFSTLSVPWAEANHHTLCNAARLHAMAIYGYYLLGSSYDGEVRKIAGAAWALVPRILANYTGDRLADGIEIMGVGQAMRIISLAGARVSRRLPADPSVYPRMGGVFIRAVLSLEPLGKRPGILRELRKPS